MRQIIWAGPALADTENCLVWSGERFGGQAASRYRHLIRTAVHEISKEPALIGARCFEEFRPNAWLYHLRHSRKRAAVDGIILKSPRHFILYLEEPEAIRILRLLHDSMNIEGQVAP